MKKTVAKELQRGLHPQPASGIILLLFILLYLPFINKAFHIDDPAFLNFAQMLDWNPLRTVPIDYDYMGTILSNLTPFDTTHPILIPYFIKIITAMFGQGEIALHLAFLVFPVAAIWSLIQLNTVLFPESQHAPMRVAIFFATVPAFFVNAQSIMTDVPTLAFLLLALTGFICGSENGLRHMTYMGMVALTFALFTSYQAAAFIPLIFFYILLRRNLSTHLVLALAVPLMLLFFWLIAIYSAYDIFPLIKSRLAGSSATINDEIKRGLVNSSLIGKSVYILAYLGSATIWIVPFHYFLKKSLGRYFATLLFLLLGSCLAVWNITAYPATSNLILALFIALGLQTIGTLGFLIREHIREGGEIQQALFLLAWFVCVVSYNIFLLPFGSARYLLPALPPVFLLVMNNRVWNFSVRQQLIPFLCVLGGTTVFALGAAYSDYRYAETYRTFAGEVIDIRAEVGSSPAFWYVGEWGMRHYMKLAGARTLHATSNEPKAGDFVVIPEMPRFWEPSKSLQQRLVFFAERRFSSALPLRLFNRRSHAGFYAHLWGMLPFAFSTEPDEVFTVYRVVR